MACICSGVPDPSWAFSSARAAAMSESTHAEHTAEILSALILTGLIRSELVEATATAGVEGWGRPRWLHPLPRCRRWWRPARQIASRRGAGRGHENPEGHRLPLIAVSGSTTTSLARWDPRRG